LASDGGMADGTVRRLSLAGKHATLRLMGHL
jgi:hypothetical protein